MFDTLKQGIIRFYIFGLYIPFRRFAHVLRDLSRKTRYILGLKNSHLSNRNELKLPSIAWNKLCSSSGTNFKEIKKVDGNVNLAELAILNALCRTFKPAKIMEIGTFDGRTTLNFSLNTNAQIFTLDLPCNAETMFQIKGGDEKYSVKKFSGTRFSSSPNNSLSCVERITQLYGDSASFDFSYWYGQMDFVFVDGAHTYKYVANDTDIATKLLTPEKGVIVWHDYGVWKGVTRALNELNKRMPSLQLTHISGTSLVVSIRN